jgi:hypothetical protein
MSRTKLVCLFAMALFVCKTSSVFAVAGIGIHYGFDMTLKMNNKLMEQTTFDNLNLNMTGITGSLPTGFTNATTITGAQLPIFINRTNFENTGINFGGKLFVDVIPVIDAIEVSTNFGVWQYRGVIKYPNSIEFKSSQPTDPNAPFIDRVNVVYDSTELTLKNFNLSYFGLTNTPYAKLQIDATIRKYFLQIPPVVKIVKFYGGAGFTLDFATPVLSAKLIQDALGSTLNKTLSYNEINSQIFSQDEIMKKVMQKILDGLMTPHYGCNLDLGAMVKIPVVPLGFYLDAKYIILFDKLDKYVDVGGNGLLINIGAALVF